MTIVPLPKPEPTFETFWTRYPRKVDKVLAKAKWDAITGQGLKTRMLDRDTGQYLEIELKATPAEIMAGLKRYWDQIIREDTPQKYICHAATFLNRGRWMDML